MMTVMITRKMMLLINEGAHEKSEKQMVMKSFVTGQKRRTLIDPHEADVYLKHPSLQRSTILIIMAMLSDSLVNIIM